MRLRRRVSPTVLNLSPPQPPFSPSRLLSVHSTSLPCFDLPSALSASPRLLYCLVVLVLTLSREREPFRSTSSTSDDRLSPAFPCRHSSYPRPVSSQPRRHFRYCSPMALFRPDLFERQNVLETLISCGSEKERGREKLWMKEKDRGFFLLRGKRNENCADPTSALVHLLARKECNGR